MHLYMHKKLLKSKHEFKYINSAVSFWSGNLSNQPERLPIGAYGPDPVYVSPSLIIVVVPRSA